MVEGKVNYCSYNTTKDMQASGIHAYTYGHLHIHFTSISAIEDSQVHMSVYLNPLSDCNSLISIWQLVTMTYCIPLGDCGAVQAPTNGRQFVSGTTVGHSVNYTCNPGYNLLGNSSRTCQDNGQWSGTPPSCSRKLCTCNTWSIA